MFGYDNVHTVTVCVSDPTADAVIPIWKAPTRLAKVEILEAWILSDTAIAGASTQIAAALVDKGPAGTATESLMTGTLGTATTGDWAALTPRNFTITEGTIDGGDYVALKYDETGTIAPLNLVVGFNWVSGVGA